MQIYFKLVPSYLHAQHRHIRNSEQKIISTFKEFKTGNIKHKAYTHETFKEGCDTHTQYT